MPQSKNRPNQPSTESTRRVRPEPFRELLGQVQKEIDRRLDEQLARELERDSNVAVEVKAMLSALRALCSRGGKRLRPALVMVGYRASKARVRGELVYRVGVALELIQAYFLIHDDWIDGDLVRRGGPSVHAALSRRFRNEHIGASSAILAGDYAAALATGILASLDLPAPAAGRVLRAFSEMQLHAVAGQQMDLMAKSKDIELAYVLKTGSYTVHGPLLLGALLAGAPASVERCLGRLARPLGVSFQLRDDLLGAFGDPKLTGKPLGNDLTAGKRTLLVMEALKRARPAGRRVLKSVLGNAQAELALVKQALDVIESSGARHAIEQRVTELAAEARAALGPELTRDGRQLLEGAIQALSERAT
ncbi:MAG TPA: polyprenyl synthetase family protein [Polyangiaceae bacterium]|nr:polyprenyl synthetase family protein [Polyangiaceae bacterium]